MKRIKKLIVLFSLLTLSHCLMAQDQNVFNHYISNQGLLNPAYNGTRDVLSGLIVHRSQWIGVDGAPMTDAINVHGPIDDTNLGVGAILINDKVGFTNNFEFMAAASYKLQLDRKERFISFGLQAGFKSFSYDGTKAVTSEYGDPLFAGKESKFGFNFGFGTYYYASNYFAGLSIPRFFSYEYQEQSETFKNSLNFSNVHTYLYGGYVFDLDKVKLKPTALARIVPGAPLEFDISGNVLLMEQLWLGLTYRTISELAFLAEYQINRQWAVRYSFDYSLSSINRYAKAGSHEIGLQFDFSFNKRPGMRSIRYF